MAASRRWWGFGVVLVGLVTFAAGMSIRAHAGTRPKAPASDPKTDSLQGISAAQESNADVAIPVSGAKVVLDTLVISIAATGQTSASKSVTLRAQLQGRISKVLVANDSHVAAGSTLAVIASDEYELAVADAKARLRQAQATFREMTLFDDRITDSLVRAGRASAARAKSGLDAAEVALQRAELLQQRTRVIAPFGGRSASVKVVPGELVREGDDIMTIVDLDPIQVDVQVLESDVGYLTPGCPATVTLAAFPGQRFNGHVKSINPLVDEDTRTALVTVIIPNRQGRILPGMYARVSVEAHRYPNRVLVPRSAILERDRRTMLFVYTGDKGQGVAKWRYVTTGLANDSLVEIVPNAETDMVKPGEIVLTEGQTSLVHDARVHLVSGSLAAGGRPE